jgi:hypothetical protein
MPCVQAGRFIGVLPELQMFNAAAAAAKGEKAFFEIWGAFQAELRTYFAQHPEETL